MEQLMLFESEQEIEKEFEVPFEVGDHVRIIIPDAKINNSEAYLYLLDFLKKRGVIKKINCKTQITLQSRSWN